ncbi:hypothetical protein K501DRAFT_45723 [Backusella circina FSU 941]|nr:hypothetical protein K501DRAFT_45723 [Backusella circina FSU 941]
MIRTILNKPNAVSKSAFRLIYTSIPKYSTGGLQGFTEREMVAEGQWERKIDYDELDSIRKQLKVQQKESAELKHHLEDTNKKIETLKHKVNDLQNVHE